jgi:hypothetical protein
MPLPSAPYWYSSADVRASKLISPPPATSTVPFANSVAVCEDRTVVRLPVSEKFSVAGSNNSAAAWLTFAEDPPLTARGRRF